MFITTPHVKLLNCPYTEETHGGSPNDHHPSLNKKTLEHALMGCELSLYAHSCSLAQPHKQNHQTINFMPQEKTFWRKRHIKITKLP